jgi:DNA-binding NarL/FixJ family response regulator
MTALTPRQRQVVELLHQGLTCPQIARRLAIAVPTVRQHVRAVAALLPGSQPPVRRIVAHAARLLAA